MDTLSRCNEKMVTLLKCVNEWKEREKENCGSFLYSDLRNLSGFIGVVLHDTYRFFLEQQLGFLREMDLKELRRDVNWALKAYKNLF